VVVTAITADAAIIEKDTGMPIYEYVCGSCGNVSEHLVFGDSQVVRCPTCDGEQLQKLLSASSSASGIKSAGGLPGRGDTACCGSQPGAGGCVPGSCCGKTG
jgi:putative FmdB family regulatory protein